MARVAGSRNLTPLEKLAKHADALIEALSDEKSANALAGDSTPYEALQGVLERITFAGGLIESLKAGVQVRLSELEREYKLQKTLAEQAALIDEQAARIAELEKALAVTGNGDRAAKGKASKAPAAQVEA